MSAGLARQRVEQGFRVALLQDPLANLQEAERWARAIRDASALRAPRRHGEHRGGDTRTCKFCILGKLREGFRKVCRMLGFFGWDELFASLCWGF